MEVVQEELHRLRETIGSLRWDGRLTAPASTVCPVSTAAPTSEWNFIYGELKKLSERMDRLEKQEARVSQRRRRGRGHKRCHRCQQLGHIARPCRAPEPRPATKNQPSIASSSAGSTINNVKRGSMGRSQQRDMKGLTNAGSVVHPESQFLRQKQGRLAKRDLKTTAVTPSPLKMPDSQDPEVHKKAAGCARPTTRGFMNCGQLGSGRKRRPFPCDDKVGKVPASSHPALNDWGWDLVQSQRQPCTVLSGS